MKKLTALRSTPTHPFQRATSTLAVTGTGSVSVVVAHCGIPRVEREVGGGERGGRGEREATAYVI